MVLQRPCSVALCGICEVYRLTGKKEHFDARTYRTMYTVGHGQYLHHARLSVRTNRFLTLEKENLNDANR